MFSDYEKYLQSVTYIFTKYPEEIRGELFD
jgi:hypothetical protein